jgi:hypothetical protein
LDNLLTLSFKEESISSTRFQSSSASRR